MSYTNGCQSVQCLCLLQSIEIRRILADLAARTYSVYIYRYV